MKIDDVLYFEYGRLHACKAIIKKVHKKSTVLKDFESNYRLDLKSDRLVDDKVRGCNDYYTLNLIDKIRYDKLIKIEKIKHMREKLFKNESLAFNEKIYDVLKSNDIEWR